LFSAIERALVLPGIDTQPVVVDALALCRWRCGRCCCCDDESRSSAGRGVVVDADGAGDVVVEQVAGDGDGVDVALEAQRAAARVARAVMALPVM
jgi:hypothetical protein